MLKTGLVAHKKQEWFVTGGLKGFTVFFLFIPLFQIKIWILISMQSRYPQRTTCIAWCHANYKINQLLVNQLCLSMSPVFACLCMKLAQNGSSKEWAVKVSFVQSLTWNREWVVWHFSPLKINNSAQLRTSMYNVCVLSVELKAKEGSQKGVPTF